MSHRKYRPKQYEYKVIGSHSLKKKDPVVAEAYFNELGGQGWVLVSIEMSHNSSKGISFVGLMKRRIHPRRKKHH